MLASIYDEGKVFMKEGALKAQVDEEVELILGNSNSNFSGVTSTMLQVSSLQKSMMNLRIMGKHHLDDPSLYISFFQTARLCRTPLQNGQSRLFHARRVDEMIQALVLKYIFGAKFKIIFSSAAQRRRSKTTIWMTRKMDAVVAMCCASARYLEKPPSKIVYHGVREDIYHPAKDKNAQWQTLGYPGKVGIGILGRVRKQKGVHLFVESCIEALKNHPEVTAVIVGAVARSDIAFKKALEVRVEEEGMTDRIIFAGEQNFSDIPKIFSALSLVAALSDNEGFGLTIPEAMSSGAAVLASEAGAWPEIIRDGIDGYVVPVDDQAAVTEKLDLMLSDIDKLEEMGVNGRARVEEHYTVTREASELVEFFRSIQ